MSDGVRRLYMAIKTGSLRDVCDIARFNSTDELGFTPLHIAARTGRRDIVEASVWPTGGVSRQETTFSSLI
jgi:hypothetical protein